ncbi:MAG: hypothetical protein K8I30_07545, partial [Anaerolineae bacterium]|nr:hypothetical protein [Anaerolineae bacterium]
MSLSDWRIRLALAAALLFGSEILLWNDPPLRSALDWLVLAVGYLAISAALLDLGVRCRVRELFGLIVLAGIYALLNGLLLNPQTALFDVPRTLITRVLGAHTLVGLLMLLLSLSRFTRRYALAAAVVGLAWGVWVRWLPLLADMVATAAPLST